jgi:hypothetical protein
MNPAIVAATLSHADRSVKTLYGTMTTGAPTLTRW